VEDAGRQAAQQRQRVHVDRDGSVGVCLLQSDPHQGVGAALEALLCNRRAQHVAQQRLASRLVERARARGRVQAEPIERGAQRLVVRERVELERLKAAHPLRPGGGRLARHGGGGEVPLGIGGAVVGEPDQATAAKVPLDAPGRALQNHADLAGLQMAERMPVELAALLAVATIESHQV